VRHDTANGAKDFYAVSIVRDAVGLARVAHII
jgi:hypothetical protein